VYDPDVEEADALLSAQSVTRADAVLAAELAGFRPHFDRWLITNWSLPSISTGAHRSRGVVRGGAAKLLGERGEVSLPASNLRDQRSIG